MNKYREKKEGTNKSIEINRRSSHFMKDRGKKEVMEKRRRRNRKMKIGEVEKRMRWS